MLDVYLKQIDKIERLTDEQHIELFNKWKETGDKKYYTRLYNSLLQLIARIVIKRCGDKHPYVMDYIQEANLTIIRSLKNYDPSYGVPIFPFVIRYVKFLSSRLVMYQTNTVKIPMYKLERRRRQVEEFKFYSLQNKYRDGNSETYQDRMRSYDNPEESAIAKIDNEKFQSIVNRIKLSDRQKHIIRESIFNERHYGDIGKDLNISRERVRQVLNETKQTISVELQNVTDLYESNKESSSESRTTTRVVQAVEAN